LLFDSKVVGKKDLDGQISELIYPSVRSTLPRCSRSHYPCAKILQGSSVCMSIGLSCVQTSVGLWLSTERRGCQETGCVCALKRSFDGIAPLSNLTRASVGDRAVQTES
jgi:hypothetical protein